jgi:hypothetical protein
MSNRYSNTLVHSELTEVLDATATSLGANRARLTSVALWWFLNVLPPAARHRALEKYDRTAGVRSAPGRSARRRRKRRVTREARERALLLEAIVCALVAREGGTVWVNVAEVVEGSRYALAPRTDHQAKAVILALEALGADEEEGDGAGERAPRARDALHEAARAAHWEARNWLPSRNGLARPHPAAPLRATRTTSLSAGEPGAATVASPRSKAEIEWAGDRPVALPVRPQGIPTDLKRYAQWVAWDYVRHRDTAGCWQWANCRSTPEAGPAAGQAEVVWVVLPALLHGFVGQTRHGDHDKLPWEVGGSQPLKPPLNSV